MGVLAFIEITQFQQSLIVLSKDDDDDEDGGTVVWDVTGSDSPQMAMKRSNAQRALLENDQLPKSHIVHHDNHQSLLSILKKYGVNVQESLALDLEDELSVCKLKVCVIPEICGQR